MLTVEVKGRKFMMWTVDTWYTLECQSHRISGPSNLEWHKDGSRKMVVYTVLDDYHNLKGPAYEAWSPRGERYLEEYWEHGEAVSGVSPDRIAHVSAL